ncbi:type IV secretory system conjugative DNA transfer family protein [Streptomyces sp. ISL-22]|uniref:type IV secretory system conjugative DNA transfer family protein n=1 Tax=unclassified Streptomyces TaxID=2593676 RepID=UPI001BE50EA3|nr:MULTISPECIES: TraM recognition domain-containing protein [unclassified Streptomyces]MBT2418032.1 type IV secretory system conjugative DNA transfer family protein [Streptomyces sp. ISL-24]MBT2432293.1 type IV secretory system conjugative DNA transfer family protein [Streptomyces sp. ISL-22]
MTATEGKRGPSSEVGPFLFLGAVLTLVLGVVGCWAAAAAGALLSGREGPPTNPFLYVLGLMAGTARWPGVAATVVAVAEGLLVLAAAFFLARAFLKRSARPKIDRTARYLGRGKEIDKLSAAGAAATATRLGTKAELPGVFIGRALIGGRPLYGSFEDMHIDIWGPRTGKTTRRAIPAICDAPGSVLVTSNKRDVVDATRGLREAKGNVWVFDPQGRAGEAPSWWWNPLSYVTDVSKARKMAAHFALGSRDHGARTDAFFEPAGQDLLAGLLLAAAEAKEPITQVYTWLTRPKDDTPVRILRGYGHVLPAESVEGVITAPEKQRGGIYGTAMQMASCLVNPAIHPWITQGSGLAKRPEFVPADFVRDDLGTLYSLSREGKDSAGPLVTALTVAVVEAAEEAATTQPGGRLQVPLLGVLDEAANVCRWADLPDLYSHYGSRGIVLMTILQSWAQGIEVWGEKGMEKLWSAANIRVYGGGVSDTKFLNDLSQLAGEFEADTVSVSYQPAQQGGGLFSNRSTSHTSRRERVLDVADLGAMPPGRALVLASGTPPVLIETVPWWESAHAGAVRASLAVHDPGARP